MQDAKELEPPKRTEWKWLSWLLIIIALLYSILPTINIIKNLTS